MPVQATKSMFLCTHANDFTNPKIIHHHHSPLQISPAAIAKAIDTHICMQLDIHNLMLKLKILIDQKVSYLSRIAYTFTILELFKSFPMVLWA